MAFVIHEDGEDHVSFYTKNNNGELFIITEYIRRGDSDKLTYCINQYMFPKKPFKISLLDGFDH